MVSVDRLCMGCMNDSGGEDVCPICGYDSHQKNGDEFLPSKAWIKGRYLIGRVIESDGEGVTYIGWDNDDNNIVNIREFFPTGLACRGEKGAIIITEDKKFDYNTLFVEFLNLHNSLRDIELSAVAPVIEIIETNSTAYVISKVNSGVPLREFLLKNGGTLSWEQARSLFLPLISQIISLHEKGICHGGISPETVIVCRDGRLRLQGFATKDLRTAQSRLSPQLFPGYAAIEQYGENATVNVSSDVYGFAATLFRVLMGSTLPEATERITDDKISIPSKIAETLPQAVLSTLADALQIMSDTRTSDMNAFKLDIAPAADMTSSFVSSKQAARAAKQPAQPKAKKKSNAGKIAIVCSISAVVFLVILFVIWTLTDGFSFLNVEKQDKKPPVVPDESISSEIEVDDPLDDIPPEDILFAPDFSALNSSFEKIVQTNVDFKFVVKAKEYSSRAAGVVIAQDIAPGTRIERGSTIALTISLGSESIKLPELRGLDRNEAMVELFRVGMLYDNIHFFDTQDDSVDYNCVVKSDPQSGDLVTPETTIIVYVSNYKPVEPDEPSAPSEGDTSSYPDEPPEEEN